MHTYWGKYCCPTKITTDWTISYEDEVYPIFSFEGKKNRDFGCICVQYYVIEKLKKIYEYLKVRVGRKKEKKTFSAVFISTQTT